MDKDRLKGMGNQVKGEVKKTVGEMTGNERMEAEGHVDKAKGKVQEKVGEAKDGVRDAVDGGNRT
ncbi:CsbD family protein [Roseomonas sp. AR75]|uniref:CsbD family protein n=1 Tax=Roseomonas sp. AR75 TaxID=2562311 RepID=UPI0010BF91FE|nr:CsbD family protein [Roseomonas sp. AR75]